MKKMREIFALINPREEESLSFICRTDSRRIARHRSEVAAVTFEPYFTYSRNGRGSDRAATTNGVATRLIGEYDRNSVAP